MAQVKHLSICRNVTLACAVAVGWALPWAAQALDCPRVPEQSNKDWDVEVKAAVGKLGPVTGAELATRTRSTTIDLLSRLPKADRVYLEQMMYASYCSTLRDNKTLSEAERGARVHAYNTELRSTLREPTAKGAPTGGSDPRDAARRELASIPLPYTPQAFVDSVGQRKQAAALLFLKAGIDPDSEDREGTTALMQAAGHGDVALVNALVGARASVNKRNQKGETALEWAALSGQTEAVRVLLSRGADVESVNRALIFSAELGRAETLLVLMEHVRDKRKAAAEALQRAAASTFDNVDENRLLEVARLLVSQGANVNAPDGNGWTALTSAVESGRQQLVQLLIKSGAAVNYRCSCDGYMSGGYTSLALAVYKHQTEIADMLIKAGADVGVPNNDGETPLMLAAASGSSEIVDKLLSKGANPNARDKKGNTALKGASQVATVRALLAKGALVDAQNENGATPLMQAVAKGAEEVAGILIDAGANVNAQNKTGRTPLMVAADNGYVGVARLLLKRGARAADKDEDDRTALTFAEALAPGDFRTSLIAMLKKAGTK